MKLKEKVEQMIEQNADFSAEYHIKRDRYFVDYDAEDHELLIECFPSERKHSDENDLVLNNEKAWENEYEIWNWPKNEITEIREE